MKPSELENAIKKNGVAPLYLVVGEEDYLRDQAVSVIKTAAVAPESGGLSEFNLDILYGDETDAAEILTRAEEAPAFAARRCLILKAADKLPTREAERLLPYLQAPCESTTLVFVAPKLDGRTKFAQALRERAVTVDCLLPAEPHLADWIRQEGGRLGVRLNEDAILLLKELAVSLKEMTGGVLYLLRQELEKLAAYVPQGGIAGAADVEAVRGGEAGASVFDLIPAIALQDRPRALRIVARNLEAGEAPLRIFGALIWQYRRLWRLKESLCQGGGQGEAARVLRLPPFKAKELLERFSERHLRDAFRKFLEADSKLKGGSAVAPARVLEALILALCDDMQGKSRQGESRMIASGDAPKPASTGGKKGGRLIQTVRTIRPRGGLKPEEPSAH